MGESLGKHSGRLDHQVLRVPGDEDIDLTGFHEADAGLGLGVDYLFAVPVR